MKYKIAIFDLDGTILDSMEMWLNAGELFLNSLGIKENVRPEELTLEQFEKISDIL